MSWRIQQLKGLGCKILQDEQLIDFIKQNNIISVAFDGEPDIEYWQSKLPFCSINTPYNNDLLVIFVNQLYNKLEEELVTIRQKIQANSPNWVYIAINKYLITTDQSWNTLTNNYDQDLIDIVSLSVTKLDFLKIKQSYIEYDDGKYFNFVHPTTNIYYKKKSCT
jgi:hypothetical protein